MTRPFKLAILRAVHDGSHPQSTDFIDFVMTDRQSVVSYWEEVTNGWLDFADSAVFPWVSITVPANATDRVSTASAAIAAVRAANPGQDPLAGFDGALVLLHPGMGDVANKKAGQPGQPAILTNTGFDGGSNAIGSFPFSVIPTTPSDHTFACHELGHTLGFDHTFGLECSGIDYDNVGAVGPEYGSPYDVMSSATFGSRSGVAGGPKYGANPTFSGAVGTSWVGSNQSGPALSRANLHRWFPDAMAASTHEAPFPAPGTSAVHRIAQASSATGNTLLVLHPADEAASGVGRVYVEYRPAEHWDQGLSRTGSELDRPGVVVHTLEDVANKGPRVWYRGSIADGDPDTDLRLDARPLVVTVSNRGQDGEQWIELTVTTGTTQAATVTIENQDTIDHGTIAWRKQTPCHETVASGTWYTKTKGICRVTTTGLEPDVTAPTVSVDWTVGGQAVPTTGAGMEVASVDGIPRQVTCSVDPQTHELAIFSQPGETYTIEVRASASTSDPAVGTTARVDGVATFTPPGSYEGLSPDSIAALGRCLAQKAHELNLEQTIDVDSLLDHHEVWQWQQDADSIKGLIAAGTGPLVTEFRESMDLGVTKFDIPEWQIPDLHVFQR